MPDDENKRIPTDYVIESIKNEIELSSPSRRQRILAAIALAALGSIPWIGGVISAAASYKRTADQGNRDDLLREWLLQHHGKLQELRATLGQITARVDAFGEDVEQRITSESYLALVRQTFRQWDEAETAEKRRLLVQLITNAAGTRICSDDILRLFLDWLDTYVDALLKRCRRTEHVH